MKLRIVQADSLEDFAKLCKEAINDNFLAYGQMVITGKGHGVFMYTQQWVRGAENELPADND